MVVTQAGQIVTFHPDGGALLTLDRQGNPIGTLPVDVPEAHGIALVAEGDRELLWLADAAAQKDPAAGYEPKEGPPVVWLAFREGRERPPLWTPRSVS
jgi:hypothetical protein